VVRHAFSRGVAKSGHSCTAPEPSQGSCAGPSVGTDRIEHDRAQIQTCDGWHGARRRENRATFTSHFFPLCSGTEHFIWKAASWPRRGGPCAGRTARSSGGASSHDPTRAQSMQARRPVSTPSVRGREDRPSGARSCGTARRLDARSRNVPRAEHYHHQQGAPVRDPPAQLPPPTLDDAQRLRPGEATVG
jgi:hypothetical protein